MHKYLIAKATLLTRDNITGRTTYTRESIIGTIIAKSRTVAKAKAVELTNIPWPVVEIYSSLSHSELELAEWSKILWTQPEGKPVTDTNPRGAGYRSKYDKTVRINLDVGMSEGAAEWWQSQRNKTAVLREFVESQASLEKQERSPQDYNTP
jgi:hypothetical protein